MSLQMDGECIYSGSESGHFCIHALTSEGIQALYCSEGIKELSEPHRVFRPVLSLAAQGQVLYLGDEGMNVKMFNWKKGI